MIVNLKNSYKIAILLTLTALTFVGAVFGVFFIKSEASTFDPRNLLCHFEQLKILRKFTETDYLAYLTRSKSIIGQADKNTVYRGLLEWSGLVPSQNTNENTINAFERFGVDGIKFTSYAGEAKYFDIDPCNLTNSSKDTNFGQFYETRKEPLSTYGEAMGSKDIRTQVYNEGLLYNWSKALADSVSNIILAIAKFMFSLLVIFIGFSFTDISDKFGLTLENQQSILSNLLSNLFFPFVGIMFALTVGYLVYHGIIKRDFRTAVVGGIAKTFLSFALAVVLVVFPSLIEIPSKLSVFLQSIILSSMSNVTDNGNADLCYTDTDFNIDITDSDFIEKANKGAVGIITCRIWENFLVKPFIEGQFGTQYDNLNELANENSRWVKEPTVYLSAKEDRKVTNWGIFYVSVMSGKHTSIDNVRSPLIGHNHKDYYRIIDALSNYDEETIKVTPSTHKENSVEDTTDTKKLYANAYIKVKNTNPLVEWNYFIGNFGWYRIWYALLILILVLGAGIVPFLLSLSATAIGLAITILSMTAPLFLLMGCWGGIGNSILKKYTGTLISLLIKKALLVFLMLITILFMSAIIDVMSTVGYFQSIILLVIVGVIIYKQRDSLIAIFVPSLDKFENKLQEPISKLKNATKGTIKNTAMVAVAGVESKKAGGTFKSGAVEATKHLFNNSLYKTEFGRKAKKNYQETSVRLNEYNKADKNFNKKQICSACGTALTPTSIMYKDANNEIWCNSCASTIKHHKLQQFKPKG